MSVCVCVYTHSLSLWLCVCMCLILEGEGKIKEYILNLYKSIPNYAMKKLIIILYIFTTILLNTFWNEIQKKSKHWNISSFSNCVLNLGVLFSVSGNMFLLGSPFKKISNYINLIFVGIPNKVYYVLPIVKCTSHLMV